MTEQVAQLRLGRAPVPRRWQARLRGQIPSARLPELLDALPPVLGAWPKLSADRLNAFVCCDGPYLQRHGLAFARSLDRNAPGAHLHVHLINPESEALHQLQVLGLANTSLSHSIERLDLADPQSDFARTYYASVRFVRQYQLLVASGQPVFSFDVDALVRGPLGPLLHRLGREGYDCAVHTRLRTRKREEKFLVSAFYAAPTPASVTFLGDIAATIAAALVEERAQWYTDQLAFYESYLRFKCPAPRIRLYSLPKTFSDWDFDKHSLLWVAKGPLKDENPVFRAEQDLYRKPEERLRSLPRLKTPIARVCIALPRLDLPFGKPSKPIDLWSLARGPRGDDRRLRRYWQTFADLLDASFREKGCEVRRVSLPLWRINERTAKKLEGDLLLLPHRQHFDLPGLNRPAYFFMQQAFPWLFSLDRLGWSGAGSAYPCDSSGGNPASGTFERYAAAVTEGNRSKFTQPARRSRPDLVQSGEIPSEPYIFVPCQREGDTSIRLFFQHDPDDFVLGLSTWARSKGISLVFKAHPSNPAHARRLRRATEGPGVRWSDASVHDLIAHSQAVYVINSGVGLEAMLHDKPVATFGKIEYDAVTVPGNLRDLDATWHSLLAADPTDRRAAYRRFFDWYCRLHCFDLSDIEASKVRLSEWAGAVLSGAPEARSGKDRPRQDGPANTLQTA